MKIKKLIAGGLAALTFTMGVGFNSAFAASSNGVSVNTTKNNYTASNPATDPVIIKMKNDDQYDVTVKISLMYQEYDWVDNPTGQGTDAFVEKLVWKTYYSETHTLTPEEYEAMTITRGEVKNPDGTYTFGKISTSGQYTVRVQVWKGDSINGTYLGTFDSNTINVNA